MPESHSRFVLWNLDLLYSILDTIEKHLSRFFGGVFIGKLETVKAWIDKRASVCASGMQWKEIQSHDSCSISVQNLIIVCQDIPFLKGFGLKNKPKSRIRRLLLVEVLHRGKVFKNEEEEVLRRERWPRQDDRTATRRKPRIHSTIRLTTSCFFCSNPTVPLGLFNPRHLLIRSQRKTVRGWTDSHFPVISVVADNSTLMSSTVTVSASLILLAFHA
jgi:hypothetical protein